MVKHIKKGGYQYTRKQKKHNIKKKNTLHTSKSLKRQNSKSKSLHKSKQRKHRYTPKKQNGGANHLGFSNWKSVPELGIPPFVAGKMYCPNNPNTPSNYYGYETTGGVDPAVPENSIQAFSTQSGGSLGVVHYLPIELQNVIYSLQTGAENVYNSFNGEPKIYGPNPLEGGIMNKDLEIKPSKEFNLTQSIQKHY